MPNAYIHAPSATAKRVACGHCQDCNKRSRFVEFFTPWYGWNSTCLRCGRKWCDGEWMALPFMRGARQHNRDAARAFWKRLPPVANNHYGVSA